MKVTKKQSIMKLKKYIFLAATVLAMVSCSDDITDPVLQLRHTATLNPVSPSDVVITKDNKSENFPEISWEKANYGAGAVVNYEVTLTNNSNQESTVIGETGDNKLTFTNSEMNSILAKIGAYPGQSNDYTVSLKSKAFDNAQDSASNTVSFKATAYDPNTDNIDWPYAYVAVGYPDWDFTKAYLIGDPDGDGVYQGYVQFDNATSYAILDGKDVSKVLASNQTVTDEGKGFVEVTLNPDGSVSQSVPCNKWGIIGDATSGGWSSDTQMEYDENTRLWTVITSLTPNHFKFRANNDWTINYGGDGATEFGLAPSGSDISVANESAYIVTLNLTNAGKYTYSLEETTIELSSAFMTLPGSYQGWSPEAESAYKVTSEARDFKYTGSGYFDAGTEFKFYDGGTWIGIVGDITWNDDQSKGDFVIGDGANIVIPNAGYYKITADTKKMVASVAKTGWEIIGDALPDGWDKGQLMTYDPATQTWSITATVNDGDLKFRWDASWTINLGGDLNALTQGGPNIHVSAGTYKITLDANNNKATITPA